MCSMSLQHFRIQILFLQILPSIDSLHREWRCKIYQQKQCRTSLAAEYHQNTGAALHSAPWMQNTSKWLFSRPSHCTSPGAGDSIQFNVYHPQHSRTDANFIAAARTHFTFEGPPRGHTARSGEGQGINHWPAIASYSSLRRESMNQSSNGQRARTLSHSARPWFTWHLNRDNGRYGTPLPFRPDGAGKANKVWHSKCKRGMREGPAVSADGASSGDDSAESIRLRNGRG